MNFSYNWLRELVPTLSTEPSDLLRLMTLKTAECEGLEPVGEHFATTVAARVLTVEPISPGSHNRKATIDAGSLGLRTVVCGASNCRPGIVTAYAPPGTKFDKTDISRRIIEGVESDGMLCSAAELGINKDHEGIVELDAVPGTPLPALAPDHIIEVDNKSLTHRPDLWGHYGMAREVAAITACPLRDPVNPALVPTDPPAIKIANEDFTRCPRYSALVIDNVKIEDSPLWLQYRLQAVGLNPISNVVDITNYVMAELGQPMHAFDADKLDGDTIFVRNANDNERMTALNGESYHLTPAALVIADSAGPIALAGVIGGNDSAIGPSTTRIVFESANFHAANVRRTSMRLKLRTDASMRFEKSQDPANTTRGLARAVALLRRICPGIRIVGGLADLAAPPKDTPAIRLEMPWLIRKLGRDITAAEVRSILEALSFGVTESGPGVFTVTVPSWRATKDISIKDDLVEEIGRMIGYATITPVAPATPTVPPHDNPRRKAHRALRALVAAQGFDEVYNYSFLSEETAAHFGFAPEAHLKVLNPISSDQSLMRLSLIPGLWKNIQDNARHYDQFRLFEIGYEIHRKEGSLPDEVPHLAAAVYQKTKEQGPFFEAKRLAECILPGCELKPAEARAFEHPSRTADILWWGQRAGRIFEFHPNYVEGRAVLVDVNLGVVESLGAADKRYKPIRRFPSSAFDLSVVTLQRTLTGDIEKLLRQHAGPQLEALDFLRQYEGAPLAEGQKSVSFRLTIAAQDRTLSSEEVAAVRDNIISGMRSLGFDLRV